MHMALGYGGDGVGAKQFTYWGCDLRAADAGLPFLRRGDGYGTGRVAAIAAAARTSAELLHRRRGAQCDRLRARGLDSPRQHVKPGRDVNPR